MAIIKKNYSAKLKNIYLLCFSKYFIMDSKDYLKDISEIKDLMNKSSRFISLSGLSGVMAGIYALLAAFFVKTKYTEFINIK